MYFVTLSDFQKKNWFFAGLCACPTLYNIFCRNFYKMMLSDGLHMVNKFEVCWLCVDCRSMMSFAKKCSTRPFLTRNTKSSCDTNENSVTHRRTHQ